MRFSVIRIKTSSYLLWEYILLLPIYFLEVEENRRNTTLSTTPRGGDCSPNPTTEQPEKHSENVVDNAEKLLPTPPQRHHK